MRRAMAHQAEAERDRRTRVIAADGEFQASARLADAARVMGALQLRLLQTVGEVASEKNSTLVMPLPFEVMRFFEQATGGMQALSASAGVPSAAPPDPAAAAASPRPNTDGDRR